VESSCELGNRTSGSIKCWELPSGCATCGLSSGTEFHRVSYLVHSLCQCVHILLICFIYDLLHMQYTQGLRQSRLGTADYDNSLWLKPLQQSRQLICRTRDHNQAVALYTLYDGLLLFQCCELFHYHDFE
jgi:hypothetical protein